MDVKSIRRHFQVREGYWFVPKIFGFGATPVTWQGWVLTLLFVGALLADIRLVPGITAKIVLGLALTAIVIPIIIGKTDGGWRWRWGPGE